MNLRRLVVCALASTVALASATSSAYAIGNPGDTGADSLTASGISGSMCVTELANLDPNNSHVNETMWLFTNLSAPYWTEVGIWNGFNVSGNTTHVPRFYWEDNNSVYGNSWHGDFTDSVGLGSHYYAYIRHRTGNWWDVYINGWTTGSGSYQATSTGSFEQVGLEFTESNQQAESGAVQSVSYWDSGGTNHLNWPGASNSQNSPGQGFWYKQYNYYSTILNNTTWSC
jgi:hypothetical protein